MKVWEVDKEIDADGGSERSVDSSVECVDNAWPLVAWYVVEI